MSEPQVNDTVAVDASAAPPRCGVFAIIGRPNVGKSTLLNRAVGQKISITSRKPQTTRQVINGIVQHGAAQLVFVDTPGWQRQPQGRMHKMMNHEIERALEGVDGVIFMAEAGWWREEDDTLAASLGTFTGPVFLVLNKVDRLEDKARLLPQLAHVGERFAFAEVIPLSALHGHQLPVLFDTLSRHAPEREWLFDADQLTDRSERFVVAELLREKLARQLGAELPYATHVAIEAWEDRPEITWIEATIWVEKPGQKAIVIGSGGQRIKALGQAARIDIERLLDRPVYLKTWVKVKGKWTENPAILEQLGAAERR